MFEDIVNTLFQVEGLEFEEASSHLIDAVDRIPNFLNILTQIGTIPESIEHDSTAEKLFSKISDAVLARAFREIGLKSVVLKERGDSADVLAESPIHGYTLVADAKAFRMSRTAKNQKDFKVVALSGWRKDYDFAVLCSPYFQYPSSSSQIYAQALEHNVCLLSWEHLIYLISNGIKESEQLSLADVWNYSAELASQTVLTQKKKCFIPHLNRKMLNCLGQNEEAFTGVLANQMKNICRRAIAEKQYWKDEIATIQGFTREKAIEELIRAKKIREKIAQIDTYVEGLKL